jgi:hypothetical protein
LFSEMAGFVPAFLIWSVHSDDLASVAAWLLINWVIRRRAS